MQQPQLFPATTTHPTSPLTGRHVVLASLGSLGDLHPMLALGMALQQRGARVTVTSHAIYRERIVALGLGFERMRPDADPTDRERIGRAMAAHDGPRVIVEEIVMPSIRDGFTDLKAVCEDADLLLSAEIVYAGPIVAEVLGLPWVSVTLSPMPLLSYHDPPVLPQAPWLQSLHRLGPVFHRALFALGKRWSRPWCREADALRTDLGLPRANHPLFEGKHSPQLVLALFSALIAPPQPDWPINTVTTGFVRHHRNETLDDELQAFLDAGPAPLVFTLGSAAVLAAGDFYQESLKAVQQLGQRAVFLVGEEADLPPLPDTVKAVAYAPHHALFPQAAALVHSGGIGTLAEALYAGKPMLVVPFANDQPDNAARARRLGVGLTLPRHRYQAHRVVARLTTLLTATRYASRAAAIARTLDQEEGLKAAMTALESFLTVNNKKLY